MHAAKLLATLGVSALVLTGLSTATEHFDLPSLAATRSGDEAVNAPRLENVVPNVRREVALAADETIIAAPVEPTTSEPTTSEPEPIDADAMAEGRVLYRVCRVTAYHDRGITASGKYTGVGQCAAPGDIPFGSKIYIPALDRTLIATDRTHRRFRKSTVDIFMPSRRDCIQFGEQFLECIITLPAEE